MAFRKRFSFKYFSLNALLDKIQLPLLLAALCVLFFLLGSFAAYFNLAPYKAIHDAIEGGKAFYGQQKAAAVRREFRMAPDQAISRAMVKWDRKTAFNGYTLIILRFTTNAYLVDMQGRIVHRWKKPFYEAWPRPSHIYSPVRNWLIYFEGAQLLPNGDLIVQYSGLTDTPWGYGIVQLDKHSNILWKYAGHAHHNVFYNPDTGETVALTHDFIQNPLEGLRNFHYPLLADQIVILSKEGKERKRILLLNAFKDSGFEQYLQVHSPTPNFPWDLMHLNSAVALEASMAKQFPMFKPGQILFSLRNMSLIGVLDPQTEKVVWAARGPWQYQHDAKFLPNGHILMLDNLGCAIKRKTCSRALEFDPATMKIVWSYPDWFKNPRAPKFLDVVLGHVQRLPNGNTLIAKPYDGQVMEITPSGKLAWQYKLLQSVDHKIKNRSEFFIRNKGKSRYPGDFISDLALKLDHVLIYSKRFAADELPFLTQPAIQARPPFTR